MIKKYGSNPGELSGNLCRQSVPCEGMHTRNSKMEKDGQMRHFSQRVNTYFRQFIKVQALALIGFYNYDIKEMSATSTASSSGCSGKMIFHDLWGVFDIISLALVLGMIIVVLSYLRSSAHVGNPRHYNT